MNPLSAVYGQVARFRRHWYEQRPHLQRQLGCPVISVGNLVVGGSGKTPLVVMLAGMLRDEGFAPAILSRGYRRHGAPGDVVVVSDRTGVRADVRASGDEPQLLARRLAGVPVVVSADRYRAGRLARETLGADVLILDDGFQHLKVARTVNLLLMTADDTRERVIPGGRLREPLDAARRADAILVSSGAGHPAELATQLGVANAFAVRTTYGALRRIVPFGAPVTPPPGRVVTLAAIARPERFGQAVRALGYAVEKQVTFRDHHWFTPADVQRAEQAARDCHADAILTTEKDAVRLEGLVTGKVPFVFLPIDVEVEPAAAFRSWLLARVRAAEAHR